MAISSPEMMLVPRRSSVGIVRQGSGAVRRTQVDVTETTAADFAANTILVADAQILYQPTVSMLSLSDSSCSFLERWLYAFWFMQVV